MDRVFLDANVLFSAAYRSDAGLRCLWQLDNVQLVTSAYAAEEAKRNLDTADQQRELEQLLDGIELIEHHPSKIPSIEKQVELHEKDLPILLAAIDAKCTHLITGDVRHFGEYFGKRVGGVLILRPAVYVGSVGKTKRPKFT